MARYYYTDAIVALYMMKEFGIRLIVGDQGHYGYKECLSHTIQHLTNHNTNGKFYVAKESEHIFEPKEGDLAMAENKRYGKMVAKIRKDRGISFSFPGEEFYSENFEIIMRDNKQFFAAEVENENN